MVAYPNAQPVFISPDPGDFLSAPSHAALHAQEDREIEAIAAELGLNPKGAYATVVARLEAIDTTIAGLDFVDLADTPSTYSGQALLSVRVNAAETGLEFFAGAATTFVGLTDTPANFTGASLQAVRVNAGETALEFYTPGAGSASTVERDINQTTHGFSVGDWVYLSGTTYTLAQADDIMSSEVVGIVSAVADADNFTLQFMGYISGLSGLVAGEAYFISPTVAGTITSTAPSTVGQFVKPVFIADTTTSGYVFNMRGNEVVAAVGIEALDEGGSLTTAITSIDWVGAGVTATNSAGDVTVTIPGGTSTFTGLTDTPANFTGASLQAVRVNAGETALEFYTPAAGGATLDHDVNQTTHGFSVNDWVYHNGTIYTLADASAAATAESIGVVSAVAGVDDFTIQFGGRITGLSGLTAGEAHFLSETAGQITATAPTTAGAVSKPVLIADSTTSGFIFNMRGSLNVDSTSFVGSFTDGSLTAGVLTISHNLGRQYVQVQIFDNSNNFIIPDDITLTDGNTTTVDLTSFGTLTGTWHYVIMDSGTTTTTGNQSFSQSFTSGGLTAGVLTVNHSLNSQYNIVQVYDNSGDLVQPDDVTSTDANNTDIDLNSFTVTGTWNVVVLSTGSLLLSTASDLSLAGQVAEDSIFFDGTNWLRADTLDRFAIGQFTRDMALASGTQSIAGLPFKPSMIYFYGADAGATGIMCLGSAQDGGNVGGMFDNENVTAGSYNFSGSDLQFQTTGAIQYTGNVTAYNSDGFDIAWVRAGAPTGTLVINFHAFR
jgi:tartrate dehydratase beta subunit/fumarate hydratase class I family protein